MPPEALAASPASPFHPHFPLSEPPPRTGWGGFDDLRLLRPGRVALFDAAPDAVPAAARLLAGFLAAGVAARGRAVLVEAKEARIDAPMLAEAAEGLGLRPEGILSGLRVARIGSPSSSSPSPPSRLAALLEEGLPALLASEPVGALVAMDLPEAFVVGRRQGLRERETLARGLAWLRAAARLHDVPAVLCTSALARRPSRALRELLLEAVDEAVVLHPTLEGGLRVRVPARGVALLVAPPAP